MAQAGMHAILGMLVRRVSKDRSWLLFGVLLGSFIPDLDNFGVAVATVAGFSTEGIHRTATHSLFFVVAVVAVFFLLGRTKLGPRWETLGYGLGLGILMHTLLDLLIWFNGVNLFWPLGAEVNFWSGIHPPEWWMKLMDPVEFLMFGMYLWILGSWSGKFGTDREFSPRLRLWIILQAALFLIFTPLAFLMQKGFLTLYGAAYLFSIATAFGITICMRRTIEAAES